MVQLSHLYMTTGKTTGLTIRIFVGKVMSLLFDMLSRLVTTFLSRSRLYSPWNSLGQNTGVGSLSLLQGIFPTQRLNPGLLNCRWILYKMSHKGSPKILEWVPYLFSSRSSQPRNGTRVSCIAGRFFTNWALREALQRSKCLLIPWLQLPSAVILEPNKIKSVIVSTVSPSVCHEVTWLDAMIFVFWMLSFKPAHSPLSTLSRCSLFPFHFLP